ncbi:uncharacterized protein [Pyxicephalus adspersus]|uniref:uncharacterized protein n=1 Tax=Pyxicephalus adspersus TaxID=30357 RepID=UPI003B5B0E29
MSSEAPESQVKCTNSNPAVLGEDVILTCEFQAHLDVLQITWEKKQGKKTETIVTYSDMYGTNIAKPFDHHVSIFNLSSRSSSIKISKLKKEDEACYVCLFNTYPNGAFTGKVVLTNLPPESQVKCTNSNPAVLGEDVTLTCEFQAHQDVLQITWQKKQGKKTETIGTYSNMYGTNIAKPFDHHVSIFNPNSRSSSIKISKLKKEDEACYVCLFNAFPNGAFTGKVVLTNLHPAKAEINAMGIRSDSNTDDPEIKQERSWIRISVISGAMVTVIGILILFIYKACKKYGMIAASESQVKCRNTSLAVLGEDVTLTCEFQSNLDVLQVTWQKKREEKTQNMATYSEMYGINIDKLFENHVLVIKHSSGSSSIKISKLEKEDEGCYICLFNAYPNGAFKGEVCLTNLCLPPDSDSTKTLQLNKLSVGGINKEEPEMHKDKQQHSLVRILMIITGGIVMLMVTVLVILLNYKAHRQTEPATPIKPDKAETGQITPKIIFKTLVRVCNDSETVRSADESKSAKPSSPCHCISEAEKSPLYDKISKEEPNSSLKKRKKEQRIAKPTSARSLQF